VVLWAVGLWEHWRSALSERSWECWPVPLLLPVPRGISRRGIASSSAVVFLLGILLTIGLCGFGVYSRWRSGLPLDSDYLNRLFFESLGLGTASLAIVVTSWVLGSYEIRGGSLERNLPPGVSVDTILGLMVVGAIMTGINTFASYRDRVSSPRSIRGRTKGNDELGDAGPVELGPLDRPD
jgi:hypothetical protein